MLTRHDHAGKLVSGLSLERGDFQAIGRGKGSPKKLRLASLTYNRKGMCPDQTHCLVLTHIICIEQNMQIKCPPPTCNTA